MAHPTLCRLTTANDSVARTPHSVGFQISCICRHHDPGGLLEGRRGTDAEIRLFDSHISQRKWIIRRVQILQRGAFIVVLLEAHNTKCARAGRVTGQV